ncbi:MAG TPA: ATP-binding protein [Acidimicrobiales bacterium]|nr:ATP-binding protein [Acidimicrobiales bacterium]
MRVPCHEATTAQLAAAHPFAASSALPARGVLVGRDLLGGLFVHDPFDLYASGAITNPNMLVLGQIGRGKSALVKTYLYRQAAFGRRVVVLDPKGEYGALAAALGVAPVTLSPGGAQRVNPLEGSRRERVAPREQARRRLALLAALAASCLARPLSPVEHTALELALERASAGARAGVPVLPGVVEALLAPDEGEALALGLGGGLLQSASRDVALELRRLVHGELRGMFDGGTSPGLDLDGAALVLDLSAVYRSPALGAVMACATAFLEAIGTGRAQTVLVVDEAWAVLADVGVARFLQSSWKLARARGVANVAVLHRISDLAAAGSAGSVTTRIAEGLLADSETVVCYGLPHGEARAAAAALGTGTAEANLLARLPRATALWRVGGRSYLVEHRLAPGERVIVDTDARLVEAR